MYCKDRFLMFGYETYYPMGGFNDFILSFTTIDELLERTKLLDPNSYRMMSYNGHFRILDLTEMRDIKVVDFNGLDEKEFYDEDEDVLSDNKIKIVIDKVMEIIKGFSIVDFGEIPLYNGDMALK